MKTLKKFGWPFAVFASTILLLAACSKKSDSDGPTPPAPGEGVVGDWITLAGTDYYKITFTNFYTYSIAPAFNADATEKGNYSVNTKTRTITLTPDLAGSKSREWKYTNDKDDELQVTGKILSTDTQAQTVTLSRQSPEEEVKTVTVHSTAAKSELTAAMLLGSSKIKLVGEINQADFKVLHDCAPMKELDMSDVTVVGDIVVMTDSEGTEHTVEGNAIPEAAFGEITGTDGKANTTLKRIVLPRNLEIIGFSAFLGCKIGGKLEIPSKVEIIMMQAFSRCENLTGVTFPAEMKEISLAVFEFCTGLSGTVTLPSIEGVSAGMFRGCVNLTEVVLPDDMTVIGEYAFIGCERLKSINMPVALEHVYPYALTNCTALSGSLAFPEGMQEIDGYAFAGTGYDGTLTISKSVKEIGEHAFSDTKFSSIFMRWKEGEDEPNMQPSLTWFPEQFQTGKGTKTIRIPQGQTAWYTANMPAPASGCFYNLKEN